jgi:hypothetical protein
MDNKYDEYAREDIDITVIDIVIKNIKKVGLKCGNGV